MSCRSDPSLLPFLCDESTHDKRAAAYRCLRLSLNRASWAQMINAGIEWLIVRQVFVL